MGTRSLRVGLVFEDRSILTKTQRSDGMNQSWILLKSQQHRTISDVCIHLLNIFKLNRSCPNGIILAMEGFALPPFESTEILKDKEIISVKKKGGATVTIEAEDEDNLLDEVEDDGLEPGDNRLLFLTNNNRTGEFESEYEEVDEEQSHDEDSPVETVSKKRKASMKLRNSKKKTQCLGVLDDSEDESETEEIENVMSKKKKQNEETNKSAATSNKKLKSPSIVKLSKELQENAEEVNQPQPYSKPEVSKSENKEAKGQPKGLLHWKPAFKQHAQKWDTGPIITRPRHIRFESFDEEAEVNPCDQLNKVISKNTEMLELNQSSKVGSWSYPCSSVVTVGMGPIDGPDTNKAESSGVKDGQKDNSNSSDPWLNASNLKPSQETNAGWTNAKMIVPYEKSTEKNCGTGSSWGRQWSSFVPLKVNSVKQPTNQNDRHGGSSCGCGKPWSRVGGRGRGHSREGNGNMM